MTWQEELWAELNAQDNLEQIKTTGAWIDEITHILSPALGDRRREKIEEVLTQPGMDYTMLAEIIGSRRQAPG